jgi:hypothetical protein
MKRLLFVFLLYSAYSCNSHPTSAEKSILVDSMIVEGDIQTDPDTIYNGLIKYYDPKTHALLTEASFKNNVYDGHKTRYYPSGRKKIESYFKDDKLHGVQTIYDTSGLISSIQNFYHGLWYGHNLDYSKNELLRYTYINFESETLFDISYDSLGTKKLTETDNSFFFYNLVDITEYGDKGTMEKTELSVYILNPPKFNFRYSLCLLDKNSKVAEVLEEFDPAIIYTSTTYKEEDFAPGLTIALRLQGKDERTNEIFTFYEKLTGDE